MTRQEKIKNLLKLSIQPKVENPTISPNYEIKLNDWTLGRGVTNLTLYASIRQAKTKNRMFYR